MPLPPRTGHAYIVYSTKAHAWLRRVDATKALALPGVLGFISASDVPHNQAGPMVPDEELFASSEVHTVGQPIGLIVAEDPKTAEVP